VILKEFSQFSKNDGLTRIVGKKLGVRKVERREIAGLRAMGIYSTPLPKKRKWKIEKNNTVRYKLEKNSVRALVVKKINITREKKEQVGHW